MASNKVPFPFWTVATEVAAGTLVSMPVASFVIDTQGHYGGELLWRIENMGALAAACLITFQVSSDSSEWFDYHTVSSKDLLSGTVTRGPTVRLNPGMRYVRAIAYGNTTSACKVLATLAAVTAL